MLVDSDLGRVLYDNDWYRSERKIRYVDRSFKVTLTVMIVGSLILVLISDFAASQSKNIDLPMRIALEGFLIFAVVFIIYYFIYKHSTYITQRLVITEKGVMIDKPEWFYGFDMIEKASYRKGSLFILLGKIEGVPQLQISIPVQYIWDFKKIKQELSQYCTVEGV